MKIEQGKIKSAVKGVIYGPEGIGKSTLASQFPDPLFLDIEHGTKQLDVKRVDYIEMGKDRITTPVNGWNELLEALNQIVADPTICKTLVIDTADMAEVFCIENTVKENQIKSIASADHGKGYVMLAENFRRMLNILTTITEICGINVILLAHSKIVKFEQPDEFGAYDRYELKLEKKNAMALKEWADIVLFLNYKINLIQADGKMGKSYKATGGNRVIYTNHTPTWDAKNRFGLPEELPLKYESIKGIFNQDNASKKVEVKQSQEEMLNDPDFVEIEPDIPVDLQTLMSKDNISENQIIDALIQIKQIPEKKDNRRPRINDLSMEFIQNNLINSWNGLLNFLNNKAMQRR